MGPQIRKDVFLKWELRIETAAAFLCILSHPYHYCKWIIGFHICFILVSFECFFSIRWQVCVCVCVPSKFKIKMSAETAFCRAIQHCLVVSWAPGPKDTLCFRVLYLLCSLHSFPCRIYVIIICNIIYVTFYDTVDNSPLQIISSLSICGAIPS